MTLNDVLDAECRFWPKVLVIMLGTGDCWEWLAGIDKDGYGQFKIKGHTERAHRIAFAIHHRRVPELLVCHTCDNPGCVNPNHLFEGTHQDNRLNCVGKKRHFDRRLATGIANDVRAMYLNGSTQREVGKHFGINHVTVFNVIHHINGYELV